MKKNEFGRYGFRMWWGLYFTSEEKTAPDFGLYFEQLARLGEEVEASKYKTGEEPQEGDLIEIEYATIIVPKRLEAVIAEHNGETTFKKVVDDILPWVFEKYTHDEKGDIADIHYDEDGVLIPMKKLPGRTIVVPAFNSNETVPWEFACQDCSLVARKGDYDATPYEDPRDHWE